MVGCEKELAKVVFGMDIWDWEIELEKHLCGIVVAILGALIPLRST
jgi:hypothetical protein